jgi:hypothetical protein
VTRPKLLVGVLAAACVGTLLWYAWLILVADLPRGAAIATWTLWLVGTAAVVTLLAYLREFLAHRQAVGREATWKPLPGLVLLWIGGLTALVSFAFILPGGSGANGAETPETATTTSTSGLVDATSDSAAGSTPVTSVSRSKPSRTTPPAPVSTSATPRPTTTSAAAATSSTTDAATSSSTRTRGHSGHTSTGKPTPSSTTPPLFSITISPPPG